MAYPHGYERKTEGPTSFEVGFERDEEIQELEGPYWKDLLVTMDLFTHPKTAMNKLRVLHRSHLIRFLGKESPLPWLRAVSIYGNTQVPNLVHEVHLSTILAPYYRDGATIKRLYNVDPRYRADADMIHAGFTYRWEYHQSGDVSTSQMKERFHRVYADCPDTILVVCKKPSQFDKVWKAGEPIKDRLYVASLEDVARDPYGLVFLASDGDKAGVAEPEQPRE